MAFFGDSQNSAVSLGEIGPVSSGAFETLRYQDTEYGRLCSTDNEALRDKRTPLLTKSLLSSTSIFAMFASANSLGRHCWAILLVALAAAS